MNYKDVFAHLGENPYEEQIRAMAQKFITIDQKIHALEDYLRMKVIERDWHGVSDAANDLRELEAVKRAKIEASQE